MKILLANTLYQPYIGGGAEIIVGGLAEGLARRGHQVGVLTTHGEKDIQVDEINGVTVFRIPVNNIYWHYPGKKRPKWMRGIWHAIDSYNFFAKRHINQVLDRFSPDIVSSHNLPGLSVALLSVVKRRGLPVVQMLHDYYFVCANFYMYKNARTCERQCLTCHAFRLPHRRMSRKVDVVVGASCSVVQEHQKQGYFNGSSKAVVITNARRLNIDPIARHKPPLQGRDLVFGFIGTLAPIKGIVELCTAFERLLASIDRPVRLVIAGSGDDVFVAALKQRFEGPQVTFVGKVEPATFYQGIDVCVVPSMCHDVLPTVVFEALGCGVPVVGSRQGGIPEMIRDGFNGLLFDVNDPNNLFVALRRLSVDPDLLEQLRSRSVDSAAKMLDVERMLTEHESLYQAVFAGAVHE